MFKGNYLVSLMLGSTNLKTQSYSEGNYKVSGDFQIVTSETKTMKGR